MDQREREGHEVSRKDDMDPINIIEIRPIKGSTNKSKFLLRKEHLKKLLEPIKNKEVVVIAVVGQTRQGKSFLLNYMSHFLTDYQNTNGWIGDGKQPLEGFEWGTSADPQTFGLWLSKPFNVKQSNGKEMAVLLMDTQGLFDDNYTHRDWSTIVGISLLVSSCLIVNVLNDISDDILTTFNSYIDYGLKASEANSGESGSIPFQSLLFLIRDWNTPNQYKFGLTGGQQYLEKKLIVRDNQSEVAQNVYLNIQKCFKDIICFLMPPFGDVTEREDFNGSFGQLRDRFKEKLKEFISTLLNPEELVPKMIDGSPITGEELFHLFQEYLENFNREELPESQRILEAKNKLSDSIVIRKLKDLHLSQLRAFIQTKPFITRNDLRERNEVYKIEIIEDFETSMKSNNPKLVDKLYDILKTNFEIICKENEEKRVQYVEEKRDLCGQEFMDALNKELQNNGFVESETLEELFETLEERAFDSFNQFFDGEDQTHLEKDFYELTKLINHTKDLSRAENYRRIREFEKSKESLIENFVQFYKENMKKLLEDNIYLSKECFKENEKEIRNKTNDKFRKEYNFSNPSANETFFLKVDQKLNESKKRYKEKNEIKSEIISKDTRKVVSNFIDNYRKEMEERLFLVHSVEDLEKSHKIVSTKLNEDMQNRLPFKAPNFITDYIESFKSETNKLFHEFKTQIIEKIENLNKKYLTALDIATDHYINGMNDSLEAKDFLTTEELNKLHKQLRVSALGVYKCHFEDKKSNNPLLKSYETHLKESIDEEFEGFVAKNKQNRRSVERIQSLSKQFVDEYKRRIKEVFHSSKTDDEFLTKHSQILEDILQKSEASSDSSKYLAYQQTLIESSITELFQKYLTDFFEKMNDENKQILDKSVRNLEEYIKQNYLETMNGVIDSVLSEDDLNNKHLEVMEELLTEYSDGIQLMDTTLLESYQQNLQSFMKNELIVLQKKLKEKLENVIKSYESLSKLLISEYIKKIEDEIRSEEILDDQDFEGLHNVYSNDITYRFEEHLKDNPCSETQSYFTQFKQTMDEEFVKLEEKFQLKREVKLQKLEITLKDFQQMYELEMKVKVNEIRRIEDMRKSHQNVKEKLVKLFKDSHRFRDESKITPYIERLEESFNHSLADFELILEFKIQKIETLTKTMRCDIRRYYKEEIQKYFQNKGFVQKHVLIKCHKLLVRNTIERFRPEKGELTEENLKELVEESITDIFAKIEEENQMKKPTESPAIGIDLGTTNSCVAFFNPNSRNPNNVVVIPNESGYPTTPSVVSFRDNSMICVGEVAKDEIHSYHKNTISSVKRLIGRNFNDESVKNDMKLWSYKVVKGENNNPKVSVKVDGQDLVLYPEQISAEVLKKMKKIAENHLGCVVTKAVITVPAYFNDGQKQATKDSGRMAGLEVLRIINEPTAAAIAFKVDRNEETEIRKVLIFDFGGGTFDVSILEINRGKIIVRAVGGHDHLGGDDFDTNIVKYCLEEFCRECKVRVNGEEGVLAMCRLRNKCEEHKKRLTTVKTTVISIDRFYKNHDLKVVLTRDKFEELNHHLFVRSIDLVKETLGSKSINPLDIDDVVLVGGSTRIPKIQEMLSQFFGGKHLNHWVNPDEAVAKGAAIHAAYLNGQRMDEPTQLEDVTPLSLGIEIKGGWMSVIIPRNSPVPTTFTNLYVTSEDYQTVATFKVFEGERHIANNNHLLGQFQLPGIPSAPEGNESINVTFSLNDEGILHVIAKIRSTGGEKDIKITEHKGRLTKEMIDQLLAKQNNKTSGNLFN